MSDANIDWPKLYRKAVFLRAFEYVAAARFDAGEVPGLLHLSVGQEVLAGLLGALLDRGLDRLTTSHRCHALALALGVDPVQIAGEILGLASGVAGGRGGTQHIVPTDSAFMASNGIVGAPLPLAAGAALAAHYNQTGGLAVSVIGDGALNQGVVSETLNLVASQNLPLLLIVDNNGKAQDTDSASVTGGGGALARARAYGMAAERADGLNVLALAKTLARLVTFVREAGMPAVLEMRRPAVVGHYWGHGSAGLPTLDLLENQAALAGDALNDPLARLALHLHQSGDAEAALSLSLAAADAQSEAEAAFAMASRVEVAS